MYLDYHQLLKKYKAAESNYYDALDKKSKLLYSVMPHAIEVNEVVMHLSNTVSDTKLIDYASKIDEVDNLINQTRNTRDMLAYELKKMEFLIKNSVDIKDKIYYYKWIKRMTPYKFHKLVGYSRPQVYRIISEIKKILYENNKNETK